MDITKEVEEVERELLEIIIKHLEENKINVSDAQKLAADFLAMLPMQDKKDLLEKLKKLGAQYKEAQELYVEELAKTHEEKRDVALTQIRDAIAKGDIHNAITIAKTHTENSS